MPQALLCTKHAISKNLFAINNHNLQLFIMSSVPHKKSDKIKVYHGSLWYFKSWTNHCTAWIIMTMTKILPVTDAIS